MTHNTEKIWVAELEEDPVTGDLYMDLPKELIESLNWNIGDKLQCNKSDLEDFTLSKAE